MNAAFIGSYNYRLVALSICIAIIAAYAALDLAGRITTARGRAQFLWLACGSIAMGLGIWAMHYIGMEAFNFPGALNSLIQYDWPTVLLSVFIAILASAVALYLVSRPTMGSSRTVLGAIVMGSGISAMHYIGMEAMRLPAMCVYSPKLVVLSVVLSIFISYFALRLTFSLREDRVFLGWRRAGGGLLMGLAIPIMHYSGMAAVRFMPMTSYNGSLAHAVSVSKLELAGITGITLAILALVFISSIVDRRFALQSQQFAETHAQLQTVFDHMKEAIVVVDCERNIIQKNRAAKLLMGLPDGIVTREEISATFNLFLPDGTPLPAEQWPTIKALRGEFLESQEFMLQREDTDKTMIAEISTTPIPNSTSEIAQILLSYRDISERKLMDEARARFAAIVEFSEDAIIGKDDKGIVTSWNRGAEKVFGYTAAEMIGQSIKTLLPEGNEHEEEDILARIKRGEIVDHIESLRKRKDGKLIHVSLTISPIRDSWGKIIGASKIARDITEKRQLERQLHQSQKMEAIGQLTGGIAHDFNNLLGVVIGNLDLLETLVPNNEAALKRVGIAQKAALRGADLTRRLLVFSSNEELRPSVVKLHHSIRNMMELAACVIGPEIKITTHFDDSLPPVFVDAAGLESSLLNLVVNARDAMPKGGSINITTQLSNLEETYPPIKAGELKVGRYASVSISDTGEGMSRETIERAFEPFFTTKPRGKGTGLGLAMVYGFVKQSGGAVRIYSEPGYGTTISFYLPLAEGVFLPLSVAKAVSPAKRSGTVLVVDDEPHLLDIAAAYLAELGYTALQAENGAAALQVIAQHPGIDLVVTDIIMPGGMNGVELAQKIRQLHPGIRIIYSSGFPANALAERSMPLVDGPLLHKPYQRITFGAMIRRTMEENTNEAEQNRT
jgi:PAS domain S-box-containing protein